MFYAFWKKLIEGYPVIFIFEVYKTLFYPSFVENPTATYFSAKLHTALIVFFEGTLRFGTAKNNNDINNLRLTGVIHDGNRFWRSRSAKVNLFQVTGSTITDKHML